VTAPLNVFGVAVEGDPDAPPGYGRRLAELGPLLGAERLGASVYELDPGDSVCPYHYENTEESGCSSSPGRRRCATPTENTSSRPVTSCASARGPAVPTR
jgi:hypothetical protein